MRRFIAVIAFAAVCMADSAVMFEFPDCRTAAMTSTGEITMAAESVFIEPSGGMFQYYDNRGWLPMMEVRCVFELVNTTGQEQHISVGFPLDAKFGDSYTVFTDSMLVLMLDSSLTGQDGELDSWWRVDASSGADVSDRIPDSLNFRTFIDGEEVPVYYRSCARSLEEELIWQPVVAVWKMGFEPGQTVILENTYNTSWDYYGGGPWGAYTVNYILTTGGTWQGPIGEAFITLTIPDDLPAPCLCDTLAVYWNWTGSPVIRGREVTWRYENLDPVENLKFTVATEQRVNFWENRIDTEELCGAVSWTEEELLYSSWDYLRSSLSWHTGFDSVLLLRVLEAVPFIMNGETPENGLPADQFDTPDPSGAGRDFDQLQAMEALADLQRRVESNRLLVEMKGYAEFLPLFSNRYTWSGGDVDMYSGMPAREGKYLDLLEYLGAAVRGEEIEDPGIRAFYELTGWYHPGHSSAFPSVPEELSSRD